MTGFPTDCTQFGKDNCDLCCTIKRKHSMMLHSRGSQGWNTPKEKKKKNAPRSARSVFEHWQLWCLHLTLINLHISRVTWQIICLSLEIALTLSGQSNFSTLLRKLWRLSGTLSEAWALTFLKAVDAPMSGRSTIDEWMLVFSCLFSEPNWKRALAPVLGPEVIDSKRSMWQPSLPRKRCHRLN